MLPLQYSCGKILRVVFKNLYIEKILGHKYNACWSKRHNRGGRGRAQKEHQRPLKSKEESHLHKRCL